jgi:hypothetical protein
LIVCGLGWSAELLGPPELVERLHQAFAAVSACECSPPCRPEASYRIDRDRRGADFRLDAPGEERRGTWPSIVDGFFDIAERDFASGSTQTVVHAGVVEIGGRAVVVPGRSRAGKTTLVLALVAAGATYLSDEFAVFGDDGLVEGFRRPPRSREGLEVDTSPQLRPHEAIPLGLVLATYFDPGTPSELRTGTPGEGVVALVENAVMARDRPGQVTRDLALAVRGVEVLVGARGEADVVAKRLLDAPTELD